MAPEISLGVLSDNPLIRHDIKRFSEHFGLGLSINIPWQDWSVQDPDLRNGVSCWFVDTDRHASDSEIMAFLQESSAAVIFGVAAFSQDQRKRLREFAALMQKLVLELDRQYCSEQDFEIWVLAASTGGPNAVKEFIDSLPENFPVAFLYAQHLDESGSKALVEVIGRNAKIPVRSICSVTRLQPGVLYKVPIDSMIDFTPNFAFELKHPWSGIYSPSIDELLTNVHRCFGRRAHVIYFSGMGADGADKAAKMHALGSQVWAQSQSSSVSVAMPESVIKKGLCKHIAAPKDLALLLKARMQRKRAVSFN